MTKYEELNKFKLHRLNFFTDAVLAIVMTLLVLELHLPHIENKDSPSELWAAMQEQLPHFLAFILTFLFMVNA